KSSKKIPTTFWPLVRPAAPSVSTCRGITVLLVAMTFSEIDALGRRTPPSMFDGYVPLCSVAEQRDRGPWNNEAQRYRPDQQWSKLSISSASHHKYVIEIFGLQLRGH